MLTSVCTAMTMWLPGRVDVQRHPKEGEMEAKQCSPPASDMTRMIELQNRLFK